MERQTRLPDLWLVSTDNGDTLDYAMLPSWASKLSTPTRKGDKDYAAAAHLEDVLKQVPADHLAVIMEDDDWYHAQHVEMVTATLTPEVPFAGSLDVVYYHVPMRMMRYMRTEVPPENSVGLHPSFLPIYASAIGKSGVLLKESVKMQTCPRTCVGIKGVGYGLPGRAGVTKKHKSATVASKQYMPDLNCVSFRQWLGADADAYLSLVKR
jgi:hypothetical protein